jgi:hypothetical protein
VTGASRTWLRRVLLILALGNGPGAFAQAAGQESLLIDRIRQPPRADDMLDAEDKARAIDRLGQGHAEAAILPLIDCLSDTRALNGSDNWVGSHAANALAGITGQNFGIDAAAWRRWYATRDGANPGQPGR